MGTEQQLTQAVTPYRFPGIAYPAAAYASSVGCMDSISEATGSYPMPMAGAGFAPSIFGGGCGMQFGGMMPGMGMYGPGGPGSEKWYMTMLQAQDNDQEIRTKQLEHSVDLNLKSQRAKYQTENHNDRVSSQIAVLKGLIKENNQDQIPAAYETLKEAVRDNLKHIANNVEPTEHQIETEAKKAYAEAMQGATLVDDIHKYGDSPFMSGFYKALGGVGWAFMEHKTSTHNIADIEGVKVPKSEQAKEIAGKVVGGIITAFGALALWKLGKKALKVNPIPIVQEAEKVLSHDEQLAKLRPMADKYGKEVMAEMGIEKEALLDHLRWDSLPTDTSDSAKAYCAVMAKIRDIEAVQRASEFEKLGIKS